MLEVIINRYEVNWKIKKSNLLLILRQKEIQRKCQYEKVRYFVPAFLSNYR